MKWDVQRTVDDGDILPLRRAESDHPRVLGRVNPEYMITEQRRGRFAFGEEWWGYTHQLWLKLQSGIRPGQETGRDMPFG